MASMEIALGALRTLMYRVSGIVIWAVIGIVTARTLSVADRGTYASMIALMWIVAALSPGIADAAGYFVSKRGFRPGEVMAAIFVLAAAVSVVQFGVLASWGLVRWDDRTLIPIIGLGIFPQLARMAMSSVFMGTGHLTRMALGSQGQAYWGLAAILVWVVLLGNKTAEDALGAFVAAQWIALAVMVLLAEPEWRRDLVRGVRWSTLRAMVTYGSLPGLATLVSMSGHRLGQIMVIRLDSAEAAGIYASAITIAEGLWLLSSATANASFHRIGTLSREEAGRLTAQTFRHLLPIVAIPAAGIAILAPFLISVLYGDRYTDGASALRIFCLAAAVYSPVSLLNTYFLVQLGRPVIGLLLSTISTAVNISLSLMLIPAYGYNGAAWAGFGAYGVATTVAVVLFLRMSQVPASELYRFGRSDLAGYRNGLRQLLRGRRLGAEPVAAASEASGSS
jgi:O-antigen/teichoic acid export membrane protein